MRQPPPLGSRTWKPEEEDYLMEKWGQISVPAIAKKLNRTTNAVKVRAQRLGLGAVLMAGEYVTLNQLLLAVNGGSSSYGYKMKSWVENRGLPVHTKKVNRCSFRVVYIEEFWEWAERYRSFIDFSKMEPLALGEEPGWVAEQRKKDFEAYAIQRKDPWGEDEDSRLKMLLSTALTPEEEAKEREEQLKQERKDAAEKALSEATARAYELRADFVATVSTAAIKKRLADIVALWAYAEYWDDTGWLTEEEIAQATGAETLAEDDEDGEDDAAFTLQAVTDAIGKTPEKALLRMIYARLGDGKSEGYFRSYWNSYTTKHEENEKLDRIYALLVKLGYEMSDDEKALQDGTHELFGEVTDE